MNPEKARNLLQQWLAKETVFPHDGDDLLFQILHLPPFQIDPQEIARITLQLGRKTRQSKPSLRKILATSPEPSLTLFSTPNPNDLYFVSQKIEKWLQDWSHFNAAAREEFLSNYGNAFHNIADAMNAGRPEIELLPESFLLPLLQKYSLSVSHLNSFLSCPLKFYYQHILRVPSPPSPSMTFGSAIHHALEHFFLQMKEAQGRFPQLEQALSHFKDYMLAEEASFNPNQFRKRIDDGLTILEKYLNTYLRRWNRVVIIEKSFRNILLNEATINGKMDKLEFEGKQVRVVDYKTGHYEKALEQLTPPAPGKPLGGDYWRQAIFYKILIDQDPANDWQTEAIVFDFVEPVNGRFHQERVAPDLASVATVKEQIRYAWRRIQQKDFHTGCGKTTCYWCQFVQAAGLVKAFHSPKTP